MKLGAGNDAKKLEELEGKILYWRNDLQQISMDKQLLEKNPMLLQKLSTKIPCSFQEFCNKHVTTKRNELKGSPGFLNNTVARVQTQLELVQVIGGLKNCVTIVKWRATGNKTSHVLSFPGY